MDIKSNRIIFSGSPGSGKTAVLEALKAEGWSCLDEAPRQVILEQQQLPDGVLPQVDFEGFAHFVFQRMLKQYRNSGNSLTFFDRALPDIIAYYRQAGLSMPAGMQEQIQAKPYANPVFLFPPWESIYEMDGIRYESFADSRKIYQHLSDVYHELAYAVVEVPRMSVEERVGFIKTVLKQSYPQEFYPSSSD